MNPTMTCGTCHRTWDERKHPAPSARCPFEHLHVHEETVMPLSASLYQRYTFFHEYAGYVTPPGAVACALALAKAEERAEKEGLAVVLEDDDLPWDGEDKAPKYVLYAECRRIDENGHREVLAGLGGIGVNKLSDPYLRVVAAELYAEALASLDAERDAIATAQAEEMASRATYAGAP